MRLPCACHAAHAVCEIHASCHTCGAYPQLRSLEISHCAALAMLLIPAMAPAAAALVSGGYTDEATHGVVMHGLRGPMEVSCDRGR